jgi:hypothetical protein
MKKLFPSLLLVMALAVSTVAGDVQAPAFSDPPPDGPCLPSDPPPDGDSNCSDPAPEGDGFSVTTSIAITNVLFSLSGVL